MSCSALKTKAFQTHPICYNQGGFCQLFKELGFDESLHFIRQLLGIFELKDFESYQALKQVEEMAEKEWKIFIANIAMENVQQHFSEKAIAAFKMHSNVAITLLLSLNNNNRRWKFQIIHGSIHSI